MPVSNWQHRSQHVELLLLADSHSGDPLGGSTRLSRNGLSATPQLAEGVVVDAHGKLDRHNGSSEVPGGSDHGAVTTRCVALPTCGNDIGDVVEAGARNSVNLDVGVFVGMVIGLQLRPAVNAVTTMNVDHSQSETMLVVVAVVDDATVWAFTCCSNAHRPTPSTKVTTVRTR